MHADRCEVVEEAGPDGLYVAKINGVPHVIGDAGFMNLSTPLVEAFATRRYDQVRLKKDKPPVNPKDTA
ncbi:MAG: hypothetical protein NTV02_02465 [Candidatus Zambryskibacteria bacterium]|nr:hypothetical protein [Candidatus Zambryskibacteria bacterium]